MLLVLNCIYFHFHFFSLPPAFRGKGDYGKHTVNLVRPYDLCLIYLMHSYLTHGRVMLTSLCFFCIGWLDLHKTSTPEGGLGKNWSLASRLAIV